MFLFDVPVPGHPVGRNYLKAVILVVPLTIIVLVILYMVDIMHTMDRTHQTVSEPILTETLAFTHPLILLLAEPIKDKEGIPYSGTVLYNPVTQTFSYIATDEEGQVAPIGSGSFSLYGTYLAMRSGSSTSDFILYDSSTLSPRQFIRSFETGAQVTDAVWSPDGKRFAYLVVDAANSELLIEELNSTTNPVTFGSEEPVGFSPDGTMLLTRGTSTLSVIEVGEDTDMFVLEQGIISNDLQPELLLSPSGQYLVAVSSTSTEWFVVDWDRVEFSSAGKIPHTINTEEVVFAPDDSLIMREQGSNIVKVYSYAKDTDKILITNFSLSLPEEGRLLKVLL